MRADRLLSILLLLQNHGRMTAHDLARRLEVSERTIYRDLEALDIAGVPIYTERGPGGGCELLDGYQTRLTGLNADEVHALTLLMKSAPHHLFTDLELRKPLDDAFLKLQAALPVPARNNADRFQKRIHLDNATCSTQTHVSFTQSYLPLLKQALWQDQLLALTYFDEHNGWQDAKLAPYGLVAQNARWFLVAASCHDRAVLQVIPVWQIYSSELLPENFVFPTHFDLAHYWTMYCQQHQEATQSHLPPEVIAASYLESFVGDETLYNTMPIAERKIIPLRRPATKKRLHHNKKKSYKKKEFAGEQPYKKNSVVCKQHPGSIDLIKKRRILASSSGHTIKKTGIYKKSEFLQNPTSPHFKKKPARKQAS